MTHSIRLDALIVFARYYGKEAQDVVSEAVDGGPSWYPWALASINITWWSISLVKNGGLQFFLLSPSPPAIEVLSNIPEELGEFLMLQIQLMALFHHYWRCLEPSPNVMEFESKFKIFKESVTVGLKKGMIGGLGIGWLEKRNTSLLCI